LLNSGDISLPRLISDEKLATICATVRNNKKNTMYCEDYPCCGHEPGGCPIVDEETGEQRFHCAQCGWLMPPRARSAVCEPCHGQWRRSWDEDPTGQDMD